MTNDQMQDFQEASQYLPGESGLQRQERLITAGYDKKLVYRLNIAEMRAAGNWRFDNPDSRSEVPVTRSERGFHRSFYQACYANRLR